MSSRVHARAVAADYGLRAELPEVLDEVIDERVIVVDYQHGRRTGETLAPEALAGGRFPERTPPLTWCLGPGLVVRSEMCPSFLYCRMDAPTH